MRIRSKYLVWTGVAVATAIVLYFALAPNVIAVETAEVVKGPLQVTVSEEGETRLKRRFMVSAPVAGRLTRIDIRPGDLVKAGQVLASIQPAPLAPLDERTQVAAEARVRSAEAALARARAERQRVAVERDHATTEAGRAKSLLDSGYGTQQAYDAAAAALRSASEAVIAADSVVRAAEFEVAAARAVLISRGDASGGRAVTVTAPIGGLVLKRVQESEAVVGPGTPLVEIGDLRDLEIVSDLLSTDAVNVQAGAAVMIERWGGDRTLNGRVQRVEPAGFMKISALGVEEQRVNVIVDFTDPPDARAQLGDGYRVEVRIVAWEKADAVTVPTSSLFRLDGEWAVFVVQGDVLARRPVTIGHRNEISAEVLGGVSPGDRVVVYPGESLTDGARVKVL